MKTYKCNICGADCEAFLSLDKVPSLQHKLFATQQQAVDFPLSAVDFFYCNNCYHININKINSADFDASYNNDQTASVVGNNHLKDVILQIEAEVSDREARIVEIGCGRGELLSKLRERRYQNLTGYDPVALDTLGGLIVNQFWDHRAGNADLFIIRHTLEEISRLDDFVGQLASALNSTGAVYCELTNAEYVVRVFDIFSIYPEYSNLFSVYSLAHLFKKHGMIIGKVTRYFEGQWLGVWVRKAPLSPPHINLDEFRAKVRQCIRTLPQPVAIWAIGGRSSNFLSFFGADRSLIPNAFDINESKQGLFIPPFGQQIQSPKLIHSVRPGTIIVSSKKYLQEVILMAPESKIMTIDELFSSVATSLLH